MEQRNRTVIGSYVNREEALESVRSLKNQGYSVDEITLYTNADKAQGLGDSQGVDVSTDNINATADESDQSLWDQIKNVFSADTYDASDAARDSDNPEDDILLPYRDDIANGNIVVVVDDYRGDEDAESIREESDVVDRDPTVNSAGTTGLAGSTSAYPHADPAADPTLTTGSAPLDEDVVPPTDRIDRDADVEIDARDRDLEVDATGRDVGAVDNDLDEDEKIRLKEERLEVDKKERQTGEVNVRKEVHHDTETVEVPVEREEVVIERKPVSGKDAETTGTFTEEDEEIHIPIKEEEVEVSKRPVVKEEVNIKKEHHEDVEHVSEDVRREELDVETEGEAYVEGTEELTDRDSDLDRKDR